MILLHPAAFALFASAALLIFAAFLQSRTHQQAVSSLSLWAGLTQVQEHQTPKLHRWMDPLLLVQLLALAALIFIVVEPMHRGAQAGLRSVALVVDETASMQTRQGSGVTRFEQAIERASEILRETSASRITLIQFSSRSHVVVPPTDDAEAVQRALERLEPSWRADGSVADLLGLLSAVGGLDSFDRVVLLSDHAPGELPAGIGLEIFGEGQNVGITAFSVRENPDGPGVSVFLELRNDTADFLESRVTLQDEFTAITVTLSLGPESTERYVSPFPSSRGTRFIARMAVDDDLQTDNVRYFALARPSDLQVRWIGEENRFLRAALESTVPIRLVGPDTPADLTVVVETALDELPPGNVLLLASEVLTVNRFTRSQSGGYAQAEDAAHPLLAGVEPDGIYVESLPETLFLIPVTTILTANGLPLLSTIEEDGRSVFILSTDLRATNLPITVDFPVLIRNLLTSIARVPGPVVHEWRTVGQLVGAEGAGTLRAARTPSGSTVPLAPGQSAFAAEEPGFYTLQTSRGTHDVAVNVSPLESVRPPEPVVPHGQLPTSPSATREVLSRLWPFFAWAALALLAAEALLYIRVDASRRMR
jgi:hypothetical protein